MHGRRLRYDEYARALVALQGQHLALDEMRYGELMANIDHRLGVDFPAQRRAALWEAAQRVEEQRLRLASGGRMMTLCCRVAAPWIFFKLSQHVLNEYGKVLVPDEMRLFFGTGLR